MAKKTKPELLRFYGTQEGLHKINTIKNGLIAGTMESFAEIFGTVAPSHLQAILGSEFYAFGKKVDDPGRFSLNDIETLAGFFKVDYDIMHRFIRKNMISAQKTNSRKKKTR